MEAQYVTS